MTAEPAKGPYPRVTSSEYAHTVQRLQEIVSTSVPADAVVLIASRGDEALLELDRREGWHFPQASNGEYAGHYPEDGASAISHLEELRGRGAQYVAFPETAMWWLDHYGELREHLEDRCRLVADEPECRVFELAAVAPEGVLAETESSPVEPMPGAATSRLHAEDFKALREVVRGLLPPNASAAVVGSDPATLSALELDGYRVWAIEPDAGAPAAELAEAERLGCRFLVVTRAGFDSLDEMTELSDHVRRRYSFVTRQEELCEIYERRESSQGSQGAAHAATDGPGGQSLLARLRSMLPGRRGGKA